MKLMQMNNMIFPSPRYYLAPNGWKQRGSSCDTNRAVSKRRATKVSVFVVEFSTIFYVFSGGLDGDNDSTSR